jgi:hypothetical protein
LQPQTPKEHLKQAVLVNTKMYNILCDLPFSQNQPLKSAD